MTSLFFKDKKRCGIMSKKGGAFIGFLIALIGCFIIVYYLYPSFDIDGPEYFIVFLSIAVPIIVLISISGAIIGLVFGWILE